MLMNEKTIGVHHDGIPVFRHEVGLWLMFGKQSDAVPMVCVGELRKSERIFLIKTLCWSCEYKCWVSRDNDVTFVGFFFRLN